MAQGERRPLPKQSRSAQVHHARPAGANRYRAGGRRTAAEPLEASWRPKPHTGGRSPGGRTGVSGLIATYSWRLAALPVLLVLTAVVLVDTVGAGPSGTDAASGAADAGGEQPGEPPLPPEVTEAPGPIDVNLPSAELPQGGKFTQAGAGEWHGIPTTGAKAGKASKVYTYSVEVEDGIDPSSYGGDDAFASLVDQTLADPRGWTGDGTIAVRRVDADADPDVRISLTSPKTAHRPDMCGFAIKYESSCFRRDSGRVMINLARWVRGAIAFDGDMGTYRQYAINHEIGHAFRNGHVGCAKSGGLAPVMMQQTFGVSNDVVAKLNDAVGNQDPVDADGKTCKPNAWPFPQAKPAE